MSEYCWKLEHFDLHGLDWYGEIVYKNDADIFGSAEPDENFAEMIERYLPKSVQRLRFYKSVPLIIISNSSFKGFKVGTLSHWVLLFQGV